MKLFYLSLAFLFSSGNVQSQDSFEVHAGSITGKFLYPGMKNFVTEYNNYYANDPAGLVKPMEFKSIATGFQIGAAINYGEAFNFSIDVAKVQTGVSRAEWSLGYNRGIQLKSFLFDMDCGFFVIPSDYQLRLSVGLGITLQSTQIESFFEYGKTRSYGPESGINGVWSSWKGYTPLVLKLQFLSLDENWKLFTTFKFPILSKKAVSFGYNYSSGFGSSGDVFPATVNPILGQINQLDENFRFVNLTLGVAYNIPF